MKNEYSYNVIAVNAEGVAIAILYKGKTLPNWYQEMRLKQGYNPFCKHCNSHIKYTTVILAGDIKIGEQIYSKNFKREL